MMHDPLTMPAHADSPDADRAGPDASPRLPERFVRFLLLLVFLVREHWLAICHHRTGLLPEWWNYRSDLPAGSVQQYAAWRRGEFGTAIAWMCRRRGIGPEHKDWPQIRCAIIAFGGSVKGFRPGLPACGLQWWENPHILPGAIGEIVATPAADAMARLLSRQAVGNVPPAAPNVMRAEAPQALLPASWLSECRPTDFWRQNSTGPPTGPPQSGLSVVWTISSVTFDERGREAVSPAVLIRANR